MRDADKRRKHPTCHGCRHAMEWGFITRDKQREATKGQCLHPSSRSEWPNGCRHHVERKQ
jgi:hypothetical protein